MLQPVDRSTSLLSVLMKSQILSDKLKHIGQSLSDSGLNLFRCLTKFP
jgi:hypothetical protein